MKKILSIVVIALIGFTASAQHNLRTGYFLDGYAYKHKLNPAFGGDRGYFAIPVAGYLTTGVETGLSLSTFLYPTGNGELTTFLSPSVSAEQVLSSVKDNNPLNVNADLSVISLGFNAGKSYNTIDLSLKADVRANIPGGLFSWAKQYGDLLDLSRLGVNGDARLELSYGYSRPILDWFRIGAKVKLLTGLVKADYHTDMMKLTMTEQKWLAEASGDGYLVFPYGTLKTDGADKVLSGFEMLPPAEFLNADTFLSNLGFAVDLGVSMDILKFMTVSASVTDLGFIKWNNASRLGSAPGTWEYTGFDNVGVEGTTIDEQFSQLGDDLLELISPRLLSDNESITERLSMTAHLGLEVRMPFWQRLSVGLLGTARLDGPYSWYEGRASVNLALLRCLSLTGNYAYSSFGDSYGAALNFHPNGINLFIGVDSFKPAMNVTKQYVPIDSFNTNLAFGLNIAFGQYKGRFPKKVK